MNHEECIQMITALASDHSEASMISLEARGAVEEHLSRCFDCWEIVSGLHARATGRRAAEDSAIRGLYGCEQLRERLDELAEIAARTHGGLAHLDPSSVNHLAWCESCRWRLRELVEVEREAARGAFGSALSAPVRAGARWAGASRARQSRARGQWLPRRRLFAPTMAAGIAVAAMAGAIAALAFVWWDNTRLDRAGGHPEEHGRPLPEAPSTKHVLPMPLSREGSGTQQSKRMDKPSAAMPAAAGSTSVPVEPSAPETSVAVGGAAIQSIHGTPNVAEITMLLSPGVDWCVKRGMPITVGPYKRIELPTQYREATQRHSAEVTLSRDGRVMQGYVAGLPFPDIDPNDPLAAAKVVWNHDRKPLFTNDLSLRNFDAETGALGDGSGMSVERHFAVDHLHAINYDGRLSADRNPSLEPNPEKFRAQLGAYPILEPFDLKGVGLLSSRYLDVEREDDTWLYLPTLRRVRRLSQVQRSEALFAQDVDTDSWLGFSGNPASFDWKLLGVTELLGVLHAQNIPTRWAQGGGGFAFDEIWEPRPVYVVEGTPRQPGYAYAKRLLYVDRETWVVLYSDLYDLSQNLWKVEINAWSFRKQAFPGARTTYDDEVGFLPATVMVDMLRGHATRISMPSARFPGEEGWAFDQGARSGTNPDWFRVESMVAAGP